MGKAKNIMVCVTQQKNCEKLILKGYNEKEDEDKLYIINVVNEGENFLYNENDGDALEYLFGVSKEVGGELTVMRSDDVIEAMVGFAKEEDITEVILGVSPYSDEVDTHPIAKKLKKHLPDIKYTII